MEASVAISEDGNAIVTFTETPMSAGAAFGKCGSRLGAAVFGHKLGLLNFPQSHNAGWVFHIFYGCFWVAFVVGASLYSRVMSSESFTRSGHPVVTAVEVVSAALDQTFDADVWALSDDDLSAVLGKLEALAARQAELSLRVVREADARDLGRRMGATSTAAWLRHRLRLRPGDARNRVALANRLEPPADAPADWAANVASGSASWSMPATAAALARGACSEEHASVVAKIMAALPVSLSAEQLQAGEEQLAGWATEFDPGVVANLGRSLIHLLDADTLEDREQRAYDRRSFAPGGPW